MAMTQSALMFMGAMATGLAYLGLFKNFVGDDRWTRVLILFASSIVWGVFGLSSYDVIVRDTAYASASEPITPLVYLGFGLAGIMALFGIYEMFQAIGSDARDASEGMLS